MVKYLTSLFFAGIVLISACRSGNSPVAEKKESVKVIEVSAPGVMFNGNDLTGWEITNFGPQGPVYVSGDAIILGMGDGCTGITWKKEFPEINYEVTLEAKRIDGNDFFCGITFPVAKSPCSLIIGGWGGTTVGLSSINGRDASENETTLLRRFEENRWYSIRLRVTTDSIRAWIDREPVVDLAIEDKVLSIRPEVELSKPFGIASWRTTGAVRNIVVKGI
ncbi:MAG: DUF1080 domain-containing protein [Bacteroidales bacterium]|nr:DUF1080 domain-containing protein [Bacteroidales bacterium]